MKTHSGFTLIELMITMVVIAILTAIALPSYTKYVVRGKVPNATATLATKRVQMEQWFQDNRAYTGGPACTADTTSNKYFNFSCPVLTANTYTLQAAGKDTMAGFTYTVNESNVKTSVITSPPAPSGWTGSTTCWVTNVGGVC